MPKDKETTKTVNLSSKSNSKAHSRTDLGGAPPHSGPARPKSPDPARQPETPTFCLARFHVHLHVFWNKMTKVACPPSPHIKWTRIQPASQPMNTFLYQFSMEFQKRKPFCMNLFVFLQQKPVRATMKMHIKCFQQLAAASPKHKKRPCY